MLKIHLSNSPIKFTYHRAGVLRRVRARVQRTEGSREMRAPEKLFQGHLHHVCVARQAPHHHALASCARMRKRFESQPLHALNSRMKKRSGMVPPSHVPHALERIGHHTSSRYMSRSDGETVRIPHWCMLLDRSVTKRSSPSAAPEPHPTSPRPPASSSTCRRANASDTSPRAP